MKWKKEPNQRAHFSLKFVIYVHLESIQNIDAAKVIPDETNAIKILSHIQMKRYDGTVAAILFVKFCHHKKIVSKQLQSNGFFFTKL